jgi:hypothetical protein
MTIEFAIGMREAIADEQERSKRAEEQRYPWSFVKIPRGQSPPPRLFKYRVFL